MTELFEYPRHATFFIFKRKLHVKIHRYVKIKDTARNRMSLAFHSIFKYENRQEIEGVMIFSWIM